MAKKSATQLQAEYEAALAAGKNKKIAKLESRLNNRAMKNPVSAMPQGQYWAQQEFETNVAANRPNQNTIGGSQTYTTDPNTGQVTVDQSLSPEQQALYDQQVAQVSAANQAFMNAFNSGIPYGQAYDFSGAPSAPSTQDLAGERQRIEQGLIDRNTRYLEEDYQQRRQQVMDEMASRGNVPGTPAWNKALADLDDNLNRAKGQIRNEAIAQAGQEFERSFNIGTQGRQNYINEMAFGRTQPMAELGQLAQFGGGPTVNPQFFGFQPVQYQGPQFLDYLKTGIDQALGWGAINKPTGGGGGGGVPPGPSFSIGTAPGAIPAVPNAPSATTSNFGTGVQQGVAIGVAAS